MNTCGQRWIFVSILAAWLIAGPCTSTVLVYNENRTGSTEVPTRFDDVPAMEGFGPGISDEGFAGRLQLSKPDIYACAPIDGPAETPGVAASNALAPPYGGPSRGGMPLAPPTTTTISGEPEELEGGLEPGVRTRSVGQLPTAVLISRSSKGDSSACTFETKVIHAQAAGYDMVIVYDYVQEGMFKMGSSTDGNDPQPTVNIPLVLVTHASGLALTTLVAASSDPHGPEIYVDNTDPFVGMFVTVNLTTFMLVTGFLLALLSCGSVMVVTLHRYLRRYEDLVAGTNRPMSLPEVLQLPEVQVKAGSRLEGDSCPVCLEAYRIGDKLRSLPCRHAFHAGCITPWLTERQRTCPMCKDPVTLRPPPSPPLSSPTDIENPATVEAGPTVSPTTAPFSSSGRGGGGGGGGDRLPLLANSRGAHSDGGSIQEPSHPV